MDFLRDLRESGGSSLTSGTLMKLGDGLKSDFLGESSLAQCSMQLAWICGNGRSPVTLSRVGDGFLDFRGSVRRAGIF